MTVLDSVPLASAPPFAPPSAPFESGLVFAVFAAALLVFAVFAVSALVFALLHIRIGAPRAYQDPDRPRDPDMPRLTRISDFARIPPQARRAPLGSRHPPHRAPGRAVDAPAASPRTCRVDVVDGWVRRRAAARRAREGARQHEYIDPLLYWLPRVAVLRSRSAGHAYLRMRWEREGGSRVSGDSALDAGKVQAPGVVRCAKGGVVGWRLFYTAVGPGRPFDSCQGYLLRRTGLLGADQFLLWQSVRF